LYGYQAAIRFDPTILEVVDADPTKPGVQIHLGTLLRADFVQQNSADNSAGVIVCVVSQLAPTSPANGSGDLFTITFQAKATGLSDVYLADLKLAQADGAEIPTARYGTQIGVGNVALSPTPTFVILPTPTPTIVMSPSSGCSKTYVVQLGDTLFSIALKFGVTLESIARANNMASVHAIYIGQRLCIP
jgi:hypothetical protein